MKRLALLSLGYSKGDNFIYSSWKESHSYFNEWKEPGYDFVIYIWKSEP